MCDNIEKVLSQTKDPSPASVDQTEGALTTTAGSEASKTTPSEGGGEQQKPDGTTTDKPQNPEGDGVGGGTERKPDGTQVDISEGSINIYLHKGIPSYFCCKKLDIHIRILFGELYKLFSGVITLYARRIVEKSNFCGSKT